MRKQLFLAVTQRLKSRVPQLAHFDLWNQNVEFIEQEAVFAMPAVFMEFKPIHWETLNGGYSRPISCFACMLSRSGYIRPLTAPLIRKIHFRYSICLMILPQPYTACREAVTRDVCGQTPPLIITMRTSGKILKRLEYG